jgi:hypothetical protein
MSGGPAKTQVVVLWMATYFTGGAGELWMATDPTHVPVEAPRHVDLLSEQELRDPNTIGSMLKYWLMARCG